MEKDTNTEVNQMFWFWAFQRMIDYLWMFDIGLNQEEVVSVMYSVYSERYEV